MVTQGWYYASISTLVVRDSVASLVSGAQYVRNTRRLLSIGRNRGEEVHDNMGYDASCSCSGLRESGQDMLGGMDEERHIHRPNVLRHLAYEPH